MPLFEYKAVSPTGETVQGTMEAVSVEMVVARLQEAGNLPLKASEAGQGMFGLGLLSFGKRGMGTREVGEFTQQLSTLLGAGLPLDRSSARITALTYMPGFSLRSVLLMLSSTFTVRVSSLSTGLMNQTRPEKLWSGMASDLVSTICPY